MPSGENFAARFLRDQRAKGRDLGPLFGGVLERIATDSEALARANTAHPGHATLARRAADDRAAVEACHDVDRLRLSR